jgi:hypothetical protein
VTSTTFTVPFGDGSELPVTVTSTASEHPPANQLQPHSVTFGVKPNQAVVTLTPGAIVKPAPPPPPPAAGPQPITLAAGMVLIRSYKTLVKDYEFNGTKLPADWVPHEGDDGYATTLYDASGVSLDGSGVKLTLRNQSIDGGGHPYTSGMIETPGVTWGHGQFDTYVTSVPRTAGAWFAVWFIDPAAPVGVGREIDVLEIQSANLNLNHVTIHAYTDGDEVGGSSPVDTTKPIVASLDWQPGIITVAINGQATFQVTSTQWNADHPDYRWPFDNQALYPRINVGVGWPGDGWAPAPDATTVFPLVMKVASVKVWQ